MEERIIVCSFRIEYLLLVLYGQFQRYEMCSAQRRRQGGPRQRCSVERWRINEMTSALIRKG